MVRIQLFSKIKRVKYLKDKKSNHLTFLKKIKPHKLFPKFNLQFKLETRVKSYYLLTTWINSQSLLYYSYKFILLQPIIQLKKVLIEKDFFNKNRLFNLRFKFKHGKFKITLEHNVLKHQYFFLSPGLLLKGFDYKKSTKKLQSTKLLLVKMLRKMLLIIKIKNIVLTIKGVPTNLPQYIRTLLTPINHYLVDPTTNTLHDEITKKPFEFNFHSIFFLKSLHLNNMKLRKRGRVKRKILRKLVLKNKLSD